MNLNISLSLLSIKKRIVALLHRFHVIIFVVIVLGGTAVVVLVLNSIIIRSGESDGYKSQSNNASFDEATIKQIQELKTTSQNSGDLDLSHGRTNPFVE